MGETSNEKHRRLELQDHGHELSDVDTGRTTRFGVSAARVEDIKEEKRRERAYHDALERLLTTDLEYRRLYKDLGDTLGQAEASSDQAIDAVQDAIAVQQEANQEMRNRAPKIDGKAVFRYADGRVVNEDGNEINATIAAGIIWPDDAPSAMDYFNGMARENDLRASLNEWQTYRSGTLGEIRDRYDDRENPISKDDLRDAMDAIETNRPLESSLSVREVVVKTTADLTPSAFPDLVT